MSDDEAAKPTISDDTLTQDNAKICAMKYPFRELSDRDDAYILLYAQAANLVRTGTSMGKPFTLRDIVNATPDGSNRNPFYVRSKATDSGAMIRAIKAGRVTKTRFGEYKLTKLGAEDARAALRKTNASPSQPTKPGPIASPGTHTVTVSEKDKAWTYAARFGASPIWKIGWSHDLKGRIQELNAHVPVEYLKEEWRIAWHHERASVEGAQGMEQRVLTILADKRTQGERLRCSEKELEEAWVRAIAEL